MKRKKQKNYLPGLSVVILILLVICGCEVSTLFNKELSNEEKLKALNYSEDSIQKIIDLEIDNDVLEKNTYSKTLEVAVTSDEAKKENLDYYFKFEYKNDEKFISHLNNLISLGYNEKEITEIFDLLSSNDIDKLQEHAFIDGISNYIKFSYFKISLLDRYLNYIDDVNNDYEKCVTYVNIGLDKPYYTDMNNIKEPDSITVLVNKYNLLPSNYEPSDLVTISRANSQITVKLRSEAAKRFEELCNDASSIGYSIQGISGYRSYSYQDGLYNRYKASDPKGVDTYSARPGASEHQTGLAMDVATNTTIYTKFGTTKEYIWLKDNAHKYGFIIRYTKDNMAITGYKQEEWHIRYVGEEIAKYIYENNITYDEYYVKFLDK